MENEEKNENVSELETENTEIENDVETENNTTEEVEQTDKEFEDTSTTKTFTQEEVDSILEKRLSRQKKALEREKKDDLSKYQQLAYYNQQGLKANNLEETLEKTKDFYEKQGIHYNESPSDRDEEILAKADFQEIIDTCETVEELENEIHKYDSNDLNKRDTLVLKNLKQELINKKRITQLEKVGVTPDVYNSEEFRNFENRFSQDTPIEDVYDLYELKYKPKEEVKNPGSIKSTVTETKKNYYTQDEVDKMTDEEVTRNMDVIEKSMLKW